MTKQTSEAKFLGQLWRNGLSPDQRQFLELLRGMDAAQKVVLRDALKATAEADTPEEAEAFMARMKARMDEGDCRIFQLGREIDALRATLEAPGAGLVEGSLDPDPAWVAQSDRVDSMADEALAIPATSLAAVSEKLRIVALLGYEEGEALKAVTADVARLTAAEAAA